MDCQPAQIASREFPGGASDLSKYRWVMLSDIGLNTLLLHYDKFFWSMAIPNRLKCDRGQRRRRRRDCHDWRLHDASGDRGKGDRWNTL